MTKFDIRDFCFRCSFAFNAAADFKASHTGFRINRSSTSIKEINYSGDSQEWRLNYDDFVNLHATRLVTKRPVYDLMIEINLAFSCAILAPA